MEKKTNLVVPVRFATHQELNELTCGTLYCPVCDSKLVEEYILNKLPYIGETNKLKGWICDICESVFDLKDNLIQIGDFDGSDIYEA